MSPLSSSKVVFEATARRACPECRAVFRQQVARCPRDGAVLEPFTRDPLVGQVLAERYSIVECIGEGGMGRVYRADHEKIPRPFAIKVLFGDLAADETMQARFRSEAAAAARMNHRNIVAITDFGETSAGLLYIAMECVQGCSLRELARSEAPLPVERVADLLTQICAGLDHAHRRGLIHRDLKSDNILLTRDGDEDVVKIVDFGIALARDPAAGSRLTHEGVVVGTPDIMSPEQLTGASIDHRADLFALGVVAYELLAGKVPFDGPAMEVARKNLSAAPKPISVRSPGRDVDPALEALVMRLMAKKAADRYQSARDAARAVELALAEILGRTTPTPTPFGSGEELRIGTDETIEAQRPRDRRVIRFAVVGACAIAVAIACALVFALRATPARESDVPSTSATPPPAPDAAVLEPDAGPPTPSRAVDAGAGEPRPGVRARRKNPVRAAPEKTPEKTPKKTEDIYESRY